MAVSLFLTQVPLFPPFSFKQPQHCLSDLICKDTNVIVQMDPRRSLSYISVSAFYLSELL